MNPMLFDTDKKYPWYTLFYRRPHLLVLSLVILLVAGMSALGNLPRLEDPRIDTRNALVITSYPGASAERVEALVSDVIEDKLREIFEIKEVKSTSRAGISVITIETQDWIDSSSNEQLFSEIRDAIGEASAGFPEGVGSPIFDEKRGATAFTLLLALKASHPDTTSLTLTGRLAEELTDRLRNVHGTELVRIYGAPEEEISVSISPDKLAATGLNLGQVSNIISNADPKLPAGVLDTESTNLRFTVAKGLDGVAMVSAIPLVNQEGRYLRVEDIAKVSRGYVTPRSDIGVLDGEEVIFVAARMQTSLRADVWTNDALSVVDSFNQEFKGTVTADIAFEQNKYTGNRLAELSGNLLMGCAVVMLVILLFMGFKASWIVGLALPLCASFALFSLNFYNEQIHQMSIFGMIIAIGLLIDNAIVITDEIRINLQDPSATRVGAMAKSVSHLFAPLLASTLTTILGFMPIFLLNGNIGDFVGPIAISVVMALIGSLFISLTVIAALAARFLPKGEQAENVANKHWWQVGLQAPKLSQAFRVHLAAWIARPILVLPLVLVFCISGFVLSGTLANVFFPSADRDQFEVYMWTKEGSSIDNTLTYTHKVDSVIRESEGVKQVTWLVGGSAPSVYYNQVMTRDNLPNFSNAVVTTHTVEEAARLISRLQHHLDDTFPEVQIVVRAFGQGPPIAAPVEVEIFGPDLDILNELGQQVRFLMSSVPGISQSTASITMGEPELNVDASSDTLSYLGLSLSDLASQMQINFSGLAGGSVLESTEEIPVRVRLSDSFRHDVAGINAMPIPVTGDSSVNSAINWSSLGAVASLTLAPSISSITRQDGERVNRIQAYLLPNVPPVDASNTLRQKLNESLALPEGYRIHLAGDADEQQRAMGQLGTYAPVLLVLMLTTLILTFTSLRMAGVIVLVAILSVGLGMFSLWLSGLPIGFNPLLGSAGLIGVAINGSIVVIAAINANSEAKHGNIAAIVQETMGCSRHILSTTFTTVGGLIPLLLFSEGSFWPPLAVVLAGGVGFSVILSLVFTPTLVAAFQRYRYRHLA
ncbi:MULTISPECIES: efflux RND transporter permease subunit [Alteromonas]|jgi:multidrug efflux pump subunit AcrB|uniref:Acriflavine resistance protein B n=3 Tax=Alteromonas stellipolaris TaxID=233316 RepID=A0AAW7Z677_9ALTE|nr:MULTISPECIES: efflux RND transporter permease subunit [Alteromonas]AMJ89344.1 acriflavine resistance protein B [Alteromonas sp. Mac2]ALM92123.1 AcrB/AcrD/AcrF family protein [Alteromonas stellipolaris LMG 21856]AMJ73065.1 acriflavine resistance protein B [Alteromonas stellipolaris]AMJ85457.1 acriflavine resistance protein B [Alteromonas sp. Mac1]AMJ93175.1 acriflavine resistance protein B [Alteromonas stellipolaris]